MSFVFWTRRGGGMSYFLLGPGGFCRHFLCFLVLEESQSLFGTRSAQIDQ